MVIQQRSTHHRELRAHLGGAVLVLPDEGGRLARIGDVELLREKLLVIDPNPLPARGQQSPEPNLCGHRVRLGAAQPPGPGGVSMLRFEWRRMECAPPGSAPVRGRLERVDRLPRPELPPGHVGVLLAEHRRSAQGEEGTLASFGGRNSRTPMRIAERGRWEESGRHKQTAHQPRIAKHTATHHTVQHRAAQHTLHSKAQRTAKHSAGTRTHLQDELKVPVRRGWVRVLN